MAMAIGPIPVTMTIGPTPVIPAAVVPSGPSLPPAPSPFSLSTPATLSYMLARNDPVPDEPKPKPVTVNRTIHWGQIAPALVTPSQHVRLGPFHLSTSIDQTATVQFRA